MIFHLEDKRVSFIEAVAAATKVDSPVVSCNLQIE